MSTSAQLRKEIAIRIAGGQTQAAISQELEIGESYISNLKNDPRFLALVDTYSGVYTDAEEQTAAQIDRIQAVALDAIEDNITKFGKPEIMLKLFREMNQARATSAKNRPHKGGEEGATRLTINLPIFLQHQMKEIPATLNENNEIVEVDGVEMITASSQSVMKQLNDRQHQITERQLHTLKDELEEDFPDASEF